MQTIWKFRLDMMDEQTINVPIGSTFLSVQVQRDVPCVWALVDDNAPSVPTTVRIYGTGHPIKFDVTGLEYIGTFQLSGGALVFHLFTVIEVQQ